MLRPLTDNPVASLDADAFGFRPYIEELNAAILAAEPLPITVGVFGPWGAGKSTFMRIWENLLSFAPTTRTLWFNPWKYDQKIQVWAALIQSLLAEIGLNTELADRVRKLARTATWLGLRSSLGIAATAATGGIVGAPVLDNIVNRLADEDSKEYREINRFETDFAEAVENFVGDNGRLVVFVDDLDRCTPAAALSVLEALKLFLGDARCVFVLAMDFDVLARIASAGFPDQVVSGAAYIEKIVQLPFFLPEVGFDSIRELVAPHLGSLATNEAFWDLVQIGFGTNPRRVKRFVNVLNLAVAVASRERVERGLPSLRSERLLQLAELLIIRSEHRDFFNHLLTDPGAWRRLEASPAITQSHSDPTATAIHTDRERDPRLVPFLADLPLVRLLSTRPGSPSDHPSAPNAEEVIRMLRTVRLATGPDG